MFFDLHNDLLTSGLSKKRQDAYLDLNNESKIVLAYFTSKQANPLKKIALTFNSLKERKNLLFAIEDMHFATFSNLDLILNLPLSYATLAWSEDNNVAGGHKGDSGVTFLGRELINRFNEKGIAVDTAHLNKKSFFHVVESGKKILCSHACLDSIFSHTRNLTDEQVRILIERKGIIGLTPVGSFMSDRTVSKTDFINQIDIFCSKFGHENLSIGTDFFGTQAINGLKRYLDFTLLRLDLYKKGYSSGIVDQIFFQNAQNFFTSR